MRHRAKVLLVSVVVLMASVVVPATGAAAATCAEIGHKVFVGDSDYAPNLDADGDGVGCESFPDTSRPTYDSTTGTGAGYWMIDEIGRLYPFGDAQRSGDPGEPLGSLGPDANSATARVVKVVSSSDGSGYWVLDDSGTVHAYGVPQLGSVDMATLDADEKPSTMSPTPGDDGYWVFTSKGRVLTFGTATPMGDLTAFTLDGPIIDSVALPDGSGYYMLGSDGGVFAFGNAKFWGSVPQVLPGVMLDCPVGGIVPTSTLQGYWMVACDGGVFAFGDAGFRGSLPGLGVTPVQPVVGMVRNGSGYLMVASDGGIFNFSDQPFVGSLGGLQVPSPIVSVAVLPGA